MSKKITMEFEANYHDNGIIVKCPKCGNKDIACEDDYGAGLKELCPKCLDTRQSPKIELPHELLPKDEDGELLNQPSPKAMIAEEAIELLETVRSQASVDLDDLDKQVWPLRVSTYLSIDKFLKEVCKDEPKEGGEDE